MNVTALVRLYPPRDGAGAEWYLHEILLALQASGDTCRVALTMPGEWVFEGIPVGEDIGSPDVIVSQIDGAPTAKAMAARLHVPLVHLSHHARQFGHGATLQVANSQHVAAHGERYGPVTICRPHTPASRYAGPTSRETVTLLNRSRAKGAHVFYALAPLHPEKQFVAVTGAWDAQVPAPDQPNLTVLPNQPDIGTVLSRTGVLYQGSAEESWGRAAMEAAHRGIPSLVTPCPGVDESIGKAGLYHPYGDLASAHWILECLDDSREYEEHSRLAKERAVEVEKQTSADLAALVDAIHALA